MGCTVIDGYNKLAKTGDKQGEVCQYIFIAIENKVPLILEFLANEDDDASASILDYLKDYLHVRNYNIHVLNYGIITTRHS